MCFRLFRRPPLLGLKRTDKWILSWILWNPFKTLTITVKWPYAFSPVFCLKSRVELDCLQSFREVCLQTTWPDRLLTTSDSYFAQFRLFRRPPLLGLRRTDKWILSWILWNPFKTLTITVKWPRAVSRVFCRFLSEKLVPILCVFGFFGDPHFWVLSALINGF